VLLIHEKRGGYKSRGTVPLRTEKNACPTIKDWSSFKKKMQYFKKCFFFKKLNSFLKQCHSLKNNIV